MGTVDSISLHRGIGGLEAETNGGRDAVRLELLHAVVTVIDTEVDIADGVGDARSGVPAMTFGTDTLDEDGVAPETGIGKAAVGTVTLEVISIAAANLKRNAGALVDLATPGGGQVDRHQEGLLLDLAVALDNRTRSAVGRIFRLIPEQTDGRGQGEVLVHHIIPTNVTADPPAVGVVVAIDTTAVGVHAPVVVAVVITTGERGEEAVADIIILAIEGEAVVINVVIIVRAALFVVTLAEGEGTTNGKAVTNEAVITNAHTPGFVLVAGIAILVF